ncbi:glyco_transf_28 domain-containing protein, partial [Haematococcus lacustris]
PPPVYIGFGSLVVDDPDKLTDQFLAALKRTGLRAIIQRGWGGLGSGYGHGAKPSPPDILFIDSAPHDWLFQMSCAVVHHGGAGTTATGLMAGKPTFIVPFFGDQPFWGAACALAGVGPEPVPIDSLTTDSIVNALKELILPT